jgi:hydroxypyruvate reductase
VQNAIDAGELLHPHLRALNPEKAYIVAGAGKASTAMARAVAEELPLARGVVVAQRAEAAIGAIEVLGAAHPVPDQSSVVAAERILTLCRNAAPDEEILFLLSGGASSLIALPATGVSLAEKQALTKDLLACGAPIGEINSVRKHLSAIKGGRLSAATRAGLRTFALSDVPGGDWSAIGSGPTLPDTSTLEEARDVLRRWGVPLSAAIVAALNDARNETPKREREDSLRQFRMIGGPSTALEAARAAAASFGFEPIVLGAIGGEARMVAADHARLVDEFVAGRRRVAIISGGELSVTLKRAGGVGGRCREYLLALALSLGDRSALSAAAWDTDGVDGVGDEAGAILVDDSLQRARSCGLDAATLLNAHRSGEFFLALDDSMALGAQDTNVGDIRIILIEPT